MFTISFLISLLIAACVVVIAFLIVSWVLDTISVPPRAKTIAYAIIGLAFLIWLLQAIGLYHF